MYFRSEEEREKSFRAAQDLSVQKVVITIRQDDHFLMSYYFSELESDGPSIDKTN